jgi:hypothetical protein
MVAGPTENETSAGAVLDKGILTKMTGSQKALERESVLETLRVRKRALVFYRLTHSVLGSARSSKQPRIQEITPPLLQTTRCRTKSKCFSCISKKRGDICRFRGRCLCHAEEISRQKINVLRSGIRSLSTTSSTGDISYVFLNFTGTQTFKFPTQWNREFMETDRHKLKVRGSSVLALLSNSISLQLPEHFIRH